MEAGAACVQSQQFKSACTHFPRSAVKIRDSYRRNISLLFPYSLVATNTSLKSK